MTSELFTGIMLCGIPHERINTVIREILGIREENVRYSHFYTEEQGDFAYADTLDLSSVCRTASPVLNTAEITLHRICRDAVVMILADENGLLNVEISISANDLPDAERPQLQKWLDGLVQAGIIESAEIFDDYD